MVKMRWHKARYKRAPSAAHEEAVIRAQRRSDLADYVKQKREQDRLPIAGEMRVISRKPTQDEEVVFVIGADAPSNKTGQRIVRTFPNLAAAHRAGFTWAV